MIFSGGGGASVPCDPCDPYGTVRILCDPSGYIWTDPPPPIALGRCIDHLDQLVCGIGVWIQVVLVDNLSFVFVVLFVSQLGGCDVGWRDEVVGLWLNCAR